MKDALGNEIIIGNTYGYSNRSNGIVKVRIGEAIILNALTVTLVNCKKGKAVYASSVEEDGYCGRIHIISNTLFPLNNVEVIWWKN